MTTDDVLHAQSNSKVCLAAYLLLSAIMLRCTAVVAERTNSAVQMDYLITFLQLSIVVSYSRTGICRL
jgi:hypothetical protein